MGGTTALVVFSAREAWTARVCGPSGGTGWEGSAGGGPGGRQYPRRGPLDPAAAQRDDGARMTEKKPFPRVFWVALGLELLERLAFYGVYVNLAVYLTETVGISDVENGSLLG